MGLGKDSHGGCGVRFAARKGSQKMTFLRFVKLGNIYTALKIIGSCGSGVLLDSNHLGLRALMGFLGIWKALPTT